MPSTGRPSAPQSRPTLTPTPTPAPARSRWTRTSSLPTRLFEPASGLPRVLPAHSQAPGGSTQQAPRRYGPEGPGEASEREAPGSRTKAAAAAYAHAWLQGLQAHPAVSWRAGSMAVTPTRAGACRRIVRAIRLRAVSPSTAFRSRPPTWCFGPQATDLKLRPCGLTNCT